MTGPFELWLFLPNSPEFDSPFLSQSPSSLPDCEATIRTGCDKRAYVYLLVPTFASSSSTKSLLMFESKPSHDRLPSQRFWRTSNRRLLFLVTLSALLCCVFIFRDSSPVACQEIRSGLPSASDPISPYIRRVFQDAQGNYWIGTNEDGVARFNGGSLQYFTNRDGLAEMPYEPSFKIRQELFGLRPMVE